jgi:hypothetical protein
VNERVEQELTCTPSSILVSLGLLRLGTAEDSIGTYLGILEISEYNQRLSIKLLSTTWEAYLANFMALGQRTGRVAQSGTIEVQDESKIQNQPPKTQGSFMKCRQGLRLAKYGLALTFGPAKPWRIPLVTATLYTSCSQEILISSASVIKRQGDKTVYLSDLPSSTLGPVTFTSFRSKPNFESVTGTRLSQHWLLESSRPHVFPKLALTRIPPTI